MARALELKLGHSGFEATVARNGLEGLEKTQQGKFDLILLDLMMPGMDGFGVLEELQKRNNTIPVVVLSNLNQPEDIDKAKRLGASDFMIKSDMPLANVIERVRALITPAV